MNNKVEYKNSAKVIIKDDNKYIKKKKTTETKFIYTKLAEKEFYCYLPPIEENENSEIYQYIEEESITKQEKEKILMDILSELHIKTSSDEIYDKQQFKDMYINTLNSLQSLRNYYYELQDNLELREFPAPEEQLLLNNISNIYKAISYSEYKLRQWYDKIQTKEKIRYVQIHNNLSLEHILVGKENYLISWEKSKKDLPIYDFINFYKKEFNTCNMNYLFDIYQEKYKYTEEEQLLFETLISIPPKISFEKQHLINTINTRRNINYLNKTSEFLSKYNKENQEDNK